MGDKKILAVYDVMGIQNFIFSTNKLKENIGGSIIVQKVLDDYLIKSIEKVCQRKNNVDWKNSDSLKILKDDQLEAEVIYIGGGNALVAFKEKEKAKEVTYELSKKLLELTEGSLNIGVGYTETDFNDYIGDKKNLFEKLNINKQNKIPCVPLLGIGITKEGETDSLPAYKKDDKDNKQYLSVPAYNKRNEKSKDYAKFTDLLLEKPNYTFPDEFDDLGQIKGDNHIAVVHIDGNNMGEIIKNALSGNTSDYETSVKIQRSISKQIDENYTEVMKDLVNLIIDNMENNQEIKNKLKSKKLNKVLLRPLVLNGDDITFVTDARIGISAAEYFLNKISDKKLKINAKEISLSACVGIAIVKSHFPFYRAYQMAEDLTSSAKKKAKILAINNKEVGNWLDFHISFTGVTSGITELRRKYYQVPGMDKPEPISNTDSSYENFNLLWRPWCVKGKADDKYSWEKFKTMSKEMSEISRNKLKKLRNTSIRSKLEAELCVEEIKSRVEKIPDFPENEEKNFFIGDQTPYFDALELMDLFIELKETKDKGGENAA